MLTNSSYLDHPVWVSNGHLSSAQYGCPLGGPGIFIAFHLAIHCGDEVPSMSFGLLRRLRLTSPVWGFFHRIHQFLVLAMEAQYFVIRSNPERGGWGGEEGGR